MTKNFDINERCDKIMWNIEKDDPNYQRERIEIENSLKNFYGLEDEK